MSLVYSGLMANLRTVRYLRHKVLAKPVSTVSDGRSISDDGVYPEFCKLASQNSRVFASFRSDVRYRRILEHLTVEQAESLVAQMEKDGSQLLDIKVLERIALNDAVGEPPVKSWIRGVQISPTTLRYLKVASDIQRFFDVSTISTVTEIGVGYGGQIRVLDELKIGSEYKLFDLPPVLDLATRFLECFILNGSYSISTLNRTNSIRSSLVISMYALSELPRPLQLGYYEKILRHAKAGYLIMNGQWNLDQLSRDEWAELLSASIQFETPETARGNYVLVWGQS